MVTLMEGKDRDYDIDKNEDFHTWAMQFPKQPGSRRARSLAGGGKVCAHCGVGEGHHIKKDPNTHQVVDEWTHLTDQKVVLLDGRPGGVVKLCGNCVMKGKVLGFVPA